MRAATAATPVVLVVLAVAAVGYAYFGDRSLVSDQDRAERKRDVFPTFRVDEVTRIQIEHGAESFVLDRVDEEGGAPKNWFIDSPRRSRADPAAVELLLRELELATRVRDVGDVPASGLDAPRVRGRVRIGRLEYRFSLGADALRAEGGAYLRVEGEGTFVVGRSLKAQLLRRRDTYRDRTLVSIGVGDVARLEVRRPDGGGFTLERKGATFRLGGGRRASRDEVDHFFGALADTRADTFLDWEADGGSKPAIAVLIFPRSDPRAAVELRVGGDCPEQPDGVLVRRITPSPLAACTAKAILEVLGVDARSLVDASPLFARPDEIEQVRMEALAGGARLEMARKGGGWHLRAPEDRELTPDEAESANALVLAMASARAPDVVEPRAGEALGARFRVTVTRSGDESTEVIEVAGHDPDGAVLLRRSDDGAVLPLAPAVARRFEPHPVALRARVVPGLALDTGSVAAIDDDCASAFQRMERGADGWAIRAPAGFAPDALAIADFAGAIAHAKAQAWVDERDDGSFGFERPGSCVVRLELRDAAVDAARRHVSLTLGAREGGDVYARVSGDPAVFLLPGLVRSLAARIDIDRSAMRLDVGHLAGVTLERGDSRVALDRRGDHLVRRDREERDSGEEGGRLEAALFDFRAESAVRVGPPLPDEGMRQPVLAITRRGDADSGSGETRIRIGAPTRVDGAEMYFARVDGVAATFVAPLREVRAILDAW